MGDKFQNSNFFPFYVHPMDQKRSVKIIKETRDEIKKMESRRPSTPFSVRNIQCGFYNEQQKSSRPSSSTSIKSLKYEHDEYFNPVNRKLSPVRFQKAADADIKLQPIVTKPAIRHRKGSGSSVKLLRENSSTVFPPLLCDEKTSIPIARSLSESLEKLEIYPLPKETLLNDITTFTCDTSNNSTENIAEIRSDSSIDPDSGNPDLYEKEQNTENEFSEELSVFLSFLERNISLGSKKNEETAISIVKNIYNLFENRNAFLLEHDQRIPLFKLLFKLLDTNFPALSLHVVKLLLKMGIKEKNLSSVFHLVSKLLKSPDINLNKYQLTDTIITAISNASINSGNEAVLYGIRILKVLIISQRLEMQQCQKCVDVLFHHLKELNFMLTSDELCGSKWDEISYMILASLRHLMEEEAVWETLIKVENLTEVLRELNYSQNVENVHLIVRFISKIVDQENGCLAVSQCPKENLLQFLSVLETHRYNLDVTLQITFIIGNLVSINEQTALAFVMSSNFVSTLIVLCEYISEHIQFKDSVSDCFKSEKFPSSSGDRSLHKDILEVILKILCVFANICLHPRAGSCLAKHQDILSHLLAIVTAYAEKDTVFEAGVALHSFLVVVSNISYYLETDSDLCIKTAESIIPVLDDCFSFEVRLEAANVVRNLTRSPEVRLYIQEHSLLPAFIKLLSEDDKAFCTAAYGIVMNLLIDESSRHVFYQEQGITKVLHKLHLCAGRDWKTSALLCQIIWNYCGGENASALSVSKIEAQHLIKFLSHSIYNNAVNKIENDDSDYCTEWKLAFCPVARKLLELLQTKNATLS